MVGGGWWVVCGGVVSGEKNVIKNFLTEIIFCDLKFFVATKFCDTYFSS